MICEVHANSILASGVNASDAHQPGGQLMWRPPRI